MKIPHLLVNHIHHGVAGAIVATDLWNDAIRQNHRQALCKIKNFALLMFAQHLLKKWIPALSPSSRVMVGVACYDRVVYRKSRPYQSYLVALITTGLALRSLGLREHGFPDLIIAALAGKLFGTFWNYSFD